MFWHQDILLLTFLKIFSTKFYSLVVSFIRSSCGLIRISQSPFYPPFSSCIPLASLMSSRSHFPSTHSFIYQFIYPSIYPSIHPSIYQGQKSNTSDNTREKFTNKEIKNDYQLKEKVWNPAHRISIMNEDFKLIQRIVPMIGNALSACTSFRLILMSYHLLLCPKNHAFNSMVRTDPLYNESSQCDSDGDHLHEIAQERNTSPKNSSD